MTEISVNLAREEIANRGLDPSGDWVDSEEASKQAEFAN
jgi:hypothetical protein